MTSDEKRSLAKTAIRTLRNVPAYKGLRWNDDSWDYALFEKRYRIGIALDDRAPDPKINGLVVVLDDDTAASLTARLRRVLYDAGVGRRPIRRGGPDLRSDEDDLDEHDL